ncbi:MAG: hypothetical protein EBU82_07740 [Flavobacteriia bacterium]|jgi:hypothetical protein|nr:hypothetical protein [Flavobacteriia bacterium]
MDPRLKGSQLPPIQMTSWPLSKALKDQEGFEELQTFYPGMGLVTNIKSAPETDIWLDHKYRVTNVLSQDTQKTSGKVSLRIEKNSQESGGEIQDISGFRKITHLLDPVRWLQGKYSIPKHAFLPWHQESWEAAWNKLQDPMNQAYIEALAAYAFSRLREADISPHYHYFYGSLCGKADTYSYNITDSYMSFRHARWFWTSQEKQLFKLSFDDTIDQEVKDAILKQPDQLEDSSDEGGSEEELTGLDCGQVDNQSLHSAGDSAFESASDKTDQTAEEEDEEENSDDDEDLEIFADIRKFPVMMIFTESSEGTMDDLLDDFEEVGSEPGTKQWEDTWKAWIFQIMAALSVGQTIFGFTHNDLHSNNVVWSKTDKKFLYYKMNSGILFKVPTYGKIFRIIDFGRSIFRINEHLFYSDDFKKGNDAAEQFNFGELYDSSEPEVYPNPSFDLCRFTVGIFESLFPESPPVKKGGKLLSDEPDLQIYETESALYNLLWTWLLCDDGHNVLMDPDGSERYPDFDLYKVITSQVHNAVPADQFEKDIFKSFRVKQAGNQKVYSLYC